MKFALVSLAILAATAALAVCEETEYVPEGAMRPSETLEFLKLLELSSAKGKKTVAERKNIRELIEFSKHDVLKCNEKFFKQLHEAKIKYRNQKSIYCYLVEQRKVWEVVCKDIIATKIHEAFGKIPAEDKTMLEKLQQRIDKVEVYIKRRYKSTTDPFSEQKIAAEKASCYRSLAMEEHVAPGCKRVIKILKPFKYTGGKWFNESLLGLEVQQYLKYWENCKRILRWHPYNSMY